MQRRKRIGEHLVAAGVLDEESLTRALEIQNTENKRIGQILIDMGVISDEEIANALASQLNIPLLRLKNLDIPRETITLVTSQTAETKILIPVKATGNRLLIAMADPLDSEAIQDIRFQTGMSIEVAVSPEGDIREAFNRHYIPKNVWY
jgi:type IV pilus assembly protein PilB